jgi:hypothetical protein
MRRFATALGSLALATFLSAPAFADCIPGTGLCASAGATVGVPIPGVQVGGQVTVGIPIPNIVFPAPAPAAPAPAPQVVVPGYQPPPPPAYGYPQPAPRPVYVYAQPEPFWGASRLGIDLRVDGAAGFGGNRANASYGLGGAGLGFRYRAAPHFGLEAGVDVLGGRDWNDNKRVEVAGSLGGLLFFNPRGRVQLYLSGGFLADHAKASGTASATPGIDAFRTTSTDLVYDHVGGYAGLGLEMFAARRLSFHVDARGVIRQRVGGDSPEFTDPATGRSTNTSGGLLGSAGMTFYF